MASKSPGINITNLGGGMNNTDAATQLADNECVLAENVEFFNANIGERRNGCGPVTITSSGLDTETTIAHLSQWFPANDVLAPEWLAISVTPGTSSKAAKRSSTGTWSALTPSPALYNSAPECYEVVSQQFNSNLFLAYRNSASRLGVLTAAGVWRASGMAQPSPPTAADEGVGTFATTRYYRVRYIEKSGSTILRRSEPSTTLTKTPSGTGAGLTITKPATISEGETHWELEASTDGSTFYVLATTVVGTTTYNDETAFATGYSGGALSHAIGAYTLQPAFRFLAVDGDRLIGAGHWTDTSLMSTVAWSPVTADPGVGNSERFPSVDTGGTEINNTLTLDNFDGGPITGISASANGTWYVFKWASIYKMVRTNDPDMPYSVITISKPSKSSPGRGAIPGSIILGTDEMGSPCVYFLDPVIGPSRIGTAGAQAIVGLRETWKRINLQATSIIARGCFYPAKQQVHWWIAVDGNSRPNYKLVSQVSELRPKASIGGNGVGGGWSVATGTITQATAVSVFTEVVSIDGVTSISNRPVIGLVSPDFIQRCDTMSTDAGVAYTATVRSKAFMAAGLLNKWGAMNAALLTTANSTASVDVRLIRDMGLETSEVTTSLAPAGSETEVVKHLDNLAMSEATIIQVEFGD